jgi:Mg-chelatase subunit ChlD
MNGELNQVDLAFVVDTTGSMGPFIAAAQRQMIAMLQALSSAVEIDLQVGVVEYRDHPPEDRSFVYRTHPFTGNLRRAQRAIRRLKPDGGGDAPEAVYDGLYAACDDLAWRRHARRIAVLVGDAPPHGASREEDRFPDGCPLGLTMDGTTALFENTGVVLYALGLTPQVREPFAALARDTGGEYYAAARGTDAIKEIQSLLVNEFSDLAFDGQVRDLCAGTSGWTVNGLCASLGSSRGRVSASLSRLGRRHLLEA